MYPYLLTTSRDPLIHTFQRLVIAVGTTQLSGQDARRYLLENSPAVAPVHVHPLPELLAHEPLEDVEDDANVSWRVHVVEWTDAIGIALPGVHQPFHDSRGHLERVGELDAGHVVDRDDAVERGVRVAPWGQVQEHHADLSILWWVYGTMRLLGCGKYVGGSVEWVWSDWCKRNVATSFFRALATKDVVIVYDWLIA